MRANERFDDGELHPVGVLILVDLHVVEPRLLAGQHFGVPGEQLVHKQQEVVEVDGGACLELILIATIRRGGQHLAVGSRRFAGSRGTDPRHFPLADDAQQVGGFERRFRHANVAECRAGGGLLVATVVDREVRRIAEHSRFSWRRIFTHSEWNVETNGFAPRDFPKSFAARSCISFAALFVNVTDKIRSGRTPRAMSSAMR